MEEMAKAGVKMPMDVVVRLPKQFAELRGKGHGKGIGKKLLKGAKFIGKELYDIAAPVAKEIARDMLKQKLQEYAPAGKGLYAARVGRGMKMSAAQIRTLKKGGAIQVKPAMMDEAGRYMMSLRPEAESMLDKALSRMKGMRIMPQYIEGLMDMKRGGRSVLDEKFSVNDVIRTGKDLFGKGKKGAGPFDFLRPLERAFAPVTNVIADSGVPRRLLREGLPIATGALGGIAGTTFAGPVGGVAGATAGKLAGQRLGQALGDKYGYGLYAGAGAGVIQLGSPYLDPKSAAASPFVPKKNPFT